MCKNNHSYLNELYLLTMQILRNKIFSFNIMRWNRFPKTVHLRFFHLQLSPCNCLSILRVLPLGSYPRVLISELLWAVDLYIHQRVHGNI